MQTGAIQTGGPLNYLNEEMKCNQPYNSIKVMKVAEYHRPATPDELKALIASHVGRVCAVCREKSKGTVEQFGLNLYNAQFRKPQFVQQNREFSQQECYQFMYNLFCVAPIRGIWAEDESQTMVLNKLESQTNNEQWYRIRRATPNEDFTYAVDYIVQLFDEPSNLYRDIIGVQVKPLSILRRESSMQLNKQKNLKFKEHTGLDVLYHYYKNDLTFNAAKTEELVSQILNLA